MTTSGTGTNWTDDEVAGKVAKLLAKAESTTPEEAEALTAKAEALLVKYGIDRALVEARRAAGGAAAREEITRVDVTFQGIYARALLVGAYRVAEAFRTVRPLDASTKGARTRAVLWLVGHVSDVEAVRTLLASLTIQVALAQRAWWQASPLRAQLGSMAAYKARREFVQAFGEGAASRIRERYQVTVQDASSNEPGTALALRDRTARVDDWVARELGGTGTKRDRTSRGDARASSAGYEAGRRANVGDTPIGGDRRRLGR